MNPAIQCRQMRRDLPLRGLGPPQAGMKLAPDLARSYLLHP